MTDSQQIVYVVEDDEAVRDSLEMMLVSMEYKVAAYPTANAFLDEYDESMAGCIVLDIRMPGMDGMELQKALNIQHSILPIIFVTGHGDVPMAVEAMQQGAIDFIQKPYREQELLEKIKAALALDAEQRSSLIEKKEIQHKLDELTPREQEIMNMVIDGHANKVIAIDLDISQRTVEIHRSRVMHKMGTHSLAHLVRMIMLVK